MALKVGTLLEAEGLQTAEGLGQSQGGPGLEND